MRCWWLSRRIHPPMIALLSHLCLIWDRLISIFMGPIMTHVFSCRTTSAAQLVMFDIHVGSNHWMTPSHTRYHVCGCAWCLACVALSDTVSPCATSQSFFPLSVGREGERDRRRNTGNAGKLQTHTDATDLNGSPLFIIILFKDCLMFRNTLCCTGSVEEKHTGGCGSNSKGAVGILN